MNQSASIRRSFDSSSRLCPAIVERRVQLDAYLKSFHDEGMSEGNMSDIARPNDTPEQRQLYDYIVRFWPMKNSAGFSIEDILSSKYRAKAFSDTALSFQTTVQYSNRPVLWKMLPFAC